MSQSATADHGSYAVGQAVTITLAVRNISGHACTVINGVGGPVCGPPSLTITDSSGHQVSPSGPQPLYACVMPQPTVVAPGATLSHPFTWNQQTWQCGGTGTTCYVQVPAGRYTATGQWLVATATAFSIG